MAQVVHRPRTVQTSDQRPCVLVVDDDPVTRDTLRQLLGDAGYDVQTAEDGAAALGALDRGERWPDLVLLDMRMPFMDGPTFFECLRSRPESRRTPVVIVSGTLRSSVRGEVSGIQIVKKPFDAMKLLDLVNAMVHRPVEDISYRN
ncbi:MAG TPA: response regulator [Candidatus Acidoferrales bacterium]|jgi:CheY-like chemotaxis protein|nr:response regulator [Candidatus Acidoferrales bacterium]